ncbi:hypothetical protein NL676_006115 [Syzygium grande]|nr:hypothetical protein NL676_006115 [Syzygium grande]
MDNPKEERRGDAGGKAGRRLTPNDASSYVREVKDAFQDQPEKYDMFQQIMIDFKSQRIDRARVVAVAKELFKGHNRLIHGFNTFLPMGCEIALDEAPVSKKPASLEDAIDFIHKLKHGKGIDAIYNEVACLFAGHPDLIEAFKKFLPENFWHEEELSCITTRTSCRLEMSHNSEKEQAQAEIGAWIKREPWISGLVALNRLS